MSIKIMSWVLDHSPYEGKARLVHAVLADHASDEGICWPSQTTIARRAGCSVEHVRVTVKTMIADGFLMIVQESTRSGMAHTYKLVVPKSFGVPKSSPQPPQVDGPTSPNPSPSNRHESPLEPSSTSDTVSQTIPRCNYCSARLVGAGHVCSAMNQYMRHPKN